MAQEKSGYHQANKLAHIYLQSLEELMGRNAVKAVLTQAELSDLIGNYPPDNMAKEFDFADFTAISAAINKIYGPRGERGVSVHAGKLAFRAGLSHFATPELADLAKQLLPSEAKLRVGLKALATTFAIASDQISQVSETPDYFTYDIKRCPSCWNRTSDRSLCHNAMGILQAGVNWMTNGRDHAIRNVTCRAMGAESGLFHVYKQPRD